MGDAELDHNWIDGKGNRALSNPWRWIPSVSSRLALSSDSRSAVEVATNVPVSSRSTTGLFDPIVKSIGIFDGVCRRFVVARYRDESPSAGVGEGFCTDGFVSGAAQIIDAQKKRAFHHEADLQPLDDECRAAEESLYPDLTRSAKTLGNLKCEAARGFATHCSPRESFARKKPLMERKRPSLPSAPKLVPF